SAAGGREPRRLAFRGRALPRANRAPNIGGPTFGAVGRFERPCFGGSAAAGADPHALVIAMDLAEASRAGREQELDLAVPMDEHGASGDDDRGAAVVPPGAPGAGVTERQIVRAPGDALGRQPP